MRVGMAAAIPDADEIAESLASDPVLVDDAAERALTDAEEASLEANVDDASSPIYVVVLPEAAGDPDVLLPEIVSASGRDGTYVVLVGDTLRAGSTELQEGTAGNLATLALNTERDNGTFAVLDSLVDMIDNVAPVSSSGNGDVSTATPRPTEDDDGAGAGAWIALGVLAAAVGGVVAWLVVRKRRKERERLERERAEREMLRAELAVLADDVVSLEHEVRLKPEAGNDFEAATSRYRAAQAAVDDPNARVDLVRVRRVVEEARYSMDRARALLAGRQPPEPPHTLRRRGDHGEPAIQLDERYEPHYVGYPGGYYGGGGWYGTNNGLFTGMLLGSMIGGWGWGGHGYHDTTIINNYPDGGGEYGGGDFGGGDFGGGDFDGGGDFGGGDFDGGDFGGGDF